MQVSVEFKGLMSIRIKRIDKENITLILPTMLKFWVEKLKENEEITFNAASLLSAFNKKGGKNE